MDEELKIHHQEVKDTGVELHSRKFMQTGTGKLKSGRILIRRVIDNGGRMEKHRICKLLGI